MNIYTSTTHTTDGENFLKLPFLFSLFEQLKCCSSGQSVLVLELLDNCCCPFIKPHRQLLPLSINWRVNWPTPAKVYNTHTSEKRKLQSSSQIEKKKVNVNEKRNACLNEYTYCSQSFKAHFSSLSVVNCYFMFLFAWKLKLLKHQEFWKLLTNI